jgi:hypothetical protein
MAKQDKGAMCRCGCGERKTSRRKWFVPGHSATERLENILRSKNSAKFLRGLLNGEFRA